MSKIGIVGAGISGLVAAKTLSALGHDVVIFEKSRSLSGRCSTRLWQHHIVDHGAQYFTVTTDTFRDELVILPADQLKSIGAQVFNDAGEIVPASGGARYYFQPGNNRMGKVLSAGLDIRSEQTIREVKSVDQRWEIASEAFDAVLITAPWPQAASILGISTSGVCYVPCLTAFFEFEAEWVGNATKCYALSLRDPAEPLAWSACENHKEGRVNGDKTVFVVQASEAFSTEWLEASPEAYLPHLLNRLKKHWEITQAPSATFSHRWRYARRIQEAEFPRLPEGIFLAGDSRVESRIEDVWLDGKSAADEVDSYLASI